VTPEQRQERAMRLAEIRHRYGAIRPPGLKQSEYDIVTLLHEVDRATAELDRSRADYRHAVSDLSNAIARAEKAEAALAMTALERWAHAGTGKTLADAMLALEALPAALANVARLRDMIERRGHDGACYRLRYKSRDEDAECDCGLEQLLATDPAGRET
jgi:hypothetical protein